MSSSPTKVISQQNPGRVRQRLPIVFAVLIGLAFPCGLAWLLRAQIERGDTDFSAFYTAGKMVAIGEGAHLYDSQAQLLAEIKYTGRGHLLAYAHGPFEALLFVPFSYLPYSKAVWAWWLCDLIFAYLSIYLLLPLLPSISARRDLAFCAIGFYYSLLLTECVGQDSVLTLLLFVICFTSFQRGRYALAGLVLALTTYKAPLALPMIAMLALTARKRAPILLGFLGTCVVLVFASAAAVGWGGIVMYPHFLATFAAGSNEQYRIADMPNLRGLVFSLLNSQASEKEMLVLNQVLSAAVLLIAACAAYKARHRAESESIRFALFVVTTILVAYHEYGYDLTLLILPLYLMGDRMFGMKEKTKNQKLLSYSVVILFCASVLLALKTQIYTVLLFFFFALISREVFKSDKLVSA